MASGTTVALTIVAFFLAVMTLLLGALHLRLDDVEREMRRRLSHLDNKLTRMEVDHVEAHPHVSKGRPMRPTIVPSSAR